VVQPAVIEAAQGIALDRAERQRRLAVRAAVGEEMRRAALAAIEGEELVQHLHARRLAGLEIGGAKDRLPEAPHETAGQRARADMREIEMVRGHAVSSRPKSGTRAGKASTRLLNRFRARTKKPRRSRALAGRGADTWQCPIHPTQGCARGFFLGGCSKNGTGAGHRRKAGKRG